MALNGLRKLNPIGGKDAPISGLYRKRDWTQAKNFCRTFLNLESCLI